VNIGVVKKGAMLENSSEKFHIPIKNGRKKNMASRTHQAC
jgi:hypothetical protein